DALPIFRPAQQETFERASGELPGGAVEQKLGALSDDGCARGRPQRCTLCTNFIRAHSLLTLASSPVRRFLHRRYWPAAQREKIPAPAALSHSRPPLSPSRLSPPTTAENFAASERSSVHEERYPYPAHIRHTNILGTQQRLNCRLADIHVSLLSRRNTCGQARLGERVHFEPEPISSQVCLWAAV